MDIKLLFESFHESMKLNLLHILLSQSQGDEEINVREKSCAFRTFYYFVYLFLGDVWAFMDVQLLFRYC